MVRTKSQGEKQTSALEPPNFTEEDVLEIYSLWKFFACVYGVMPLDDVDPVMYGESVDSAIRQAKALRENPKYERAVEYFLTVIHPLLQQWGHCFSYYYSVSKRISSLEAQVDKDVRMEQAVIEDQDKILFEISQRIRDHSGIGSLFHTIASIR